MGRLVKMLLSAALPIVLVLFIAACGSSSNRAFPSGSAGTARDSNESDSAASASESGDFEWKLDLKTAAEVMEYVKDMDPDQRRNVLLEGAKREKGPLMLYTAMDQKSSAQIPEAFKRSFPELELEIWRGDGTDQVNTRALNEARAGSTAADVITLDFYYAHDLKKEDVITPHRAVNRDAYPEGLYDPDGYWSGFYVKIYCLTWNTDLTQESDTPNEWHELADPKYKGRFSLDTNDDFLLFFWRQLYGEEEGTQLARQVAANDPHIIRGRSHQMALLTAGEYDMSAAMYDMNPIRDIANKGAPLDLKYMEGPLLVSIDAHMLIKNAPHPYGAVLLKDWLTSLEGQQTVADLNFVAPLPDVTYSIDRMGKVLTEKEVFPISAEDYGPVREKTAADYSKIFGLTQ